jgi:enoyl-CoA hydratase/carnithine racemase
VRSLFRSSVCSRFVFCCFFAVVPLRRIRGQTVSAVHDDWRKGAHFPLPSFLPLARVVVTCKKGKVSASQLLLDGQLSGVVADEAALDAAVLAASRAFLSAAPNAVQSVKKAVNAVHCAPSEERQRYVQDLFGKMIASPEAAHGMAAFVAKKDPNWPQFAKSRL